MRGASLSAVVAAAIAITAGAPCGAQTQARHATAGEVKKLEHPIGPPAPTEVESPMLLEVSLGGSATSRGVQTLKIGQIWVDTSTSRYVCDQAVVQDVRVARTESPKSRVRLLIEPGILSGWYRQDIDLTLSLVAADGKEIVHKSWKKYTIGNGKGPYSGDIRRPVIDWYVPVKKFESYFADGKSPTLKILIAIHD